MPGRSAPFAAYAFGVYLTDALGAETPLGGFSAASGLPQKVAGVHKVGDVTLKRGVIEDVSTQSNWISAARSGGAAATRDVIVSERVATGAVLNSWRLVHAVPKKCTGPTLGGKSGDVAIEELVLSPEGIEFCPH